MFLELSTGGQRSRSCHFKCLNVSGRSISLAALRMIVYICRQPRSRNCWEDSLTCAIDYVISIGGARACGCAHWQHLKGQIWNCVGVEQTMLHMILQSIESQDSMVWSQSQVIDHESWWFMTATAESKTTCHGWVIQHLTAISIWGDHASGKLRCMYNPFFTHEYPWRCCDRAPCFRCSIDMVCHLDSCITWNCCASNCFQWKLI